jgi:hypothetical protein
MVNYDYLKNLINYMIMEDQEETKRNLIMQIFKSGTVHNAYS